SFDIGLPEILLRFSHQASGGGSYYSRFGQTSSSRTGRTSGLPFCSVTLAEFLVEADVILRRTNLVP
ncbi:MAG TPA: hypothetical protein VKK81_24935, partial [Candidatus Binatia bacterium]|nr:hypothetical protein [Candidatus Binatia bacterium]